MPTEPILIYNTYGIIIDQNMVKINNLFLTFGAKINFLNKAILSYVYNPPFFILVFVQHDIMLYKPHNFFF